MIFLATTFSPAMLGTRVEASVKEISLAEVKERLGDYVSAVGHEITADILTALLNREVEFNRVNLSLRPGDEIICVIPNFRASEAREFTREEVEAAGYRCFLIKTRKAREEQ